MHFRNVLSLGIGSKCTALLCGIVLLSGFAVGLRPIYQVQQAVEDRELERLADEARLTGTRFSSSLHVLEADVRYIATTAPIRSAIRATVVDGAVPVSFMPSQAWRDCIAAEFVELMAARSDYLQIRLIGASNGGMELVRVDRDDRGEIRIVAGDGLQAKGNRDYFREAIAVDPNRIYLSPIELNREFGRVAHPVVPVRRAARVVTDERGKPVGILIINQDMRGFFEEVRQNVSRGHLCYITNLRGDFLAHPQADRTFGFERETPFRIADEFPGCAIGEALLSENRWVGVVRQADGTRIAVGAHRIEMSQDYPDRSLCFVLAEPYRNVVAAFTPIRNQNLYILAGFLAVAIVLGTGLTRSITTPLRQITAAMVAYGRGSEDVKLPVAASDETGILARQFHAMMHLVREQQQERHRLIIDSCPMGMLMADEDGKIALVNSQLEQTFGYSREEMIGQPVEILLPLSARAAHPKAVAEYIRSPCARAMGAGRDLFGLRKNGSAVPLEIGLNPVQINGRVCVVASIVDITRRKEIEEQQRQLNVQLKEKNDEMEQFVYTVSHDLKTPVVTQLGFIGCLREDIERGEHKAVKESIGRIERAAHRLHQSIGDLLELSRIGRVPMQCRPVELAAIAEKVVEEMRPCFVSADVELECDFSEPCRVSVDADRLVQVLENLLGNALKYGNVTPDGQTPRVTVGSAMVNGESSLYIRDNGPGIAPAYHEKVFQLFQRLSTDRDGTGIGLTAARRIMELMGGRIRLESELGQGATFWLHFPRENVASSAQPHAPSLAA